MSHKRLLFREQAREKVLRGATQLYDSVRVTLGPKSKSVLIEKKWGHPIVCNDGVTIAKELTLKDPDENLGVQVLKEAAERTGEVVGDGTSTSTILAYSLYSEGLRNVAARASSIELKRGIEIGMKTAIESLKKLSKPIVEKIEMAQVASISAHNIENIGNLVADAVEKVGPEGVITVEEAKGMETTLEVVEGMQFDRGYLSAYFITDPQKMEAILDNPVILLVDRKISVLKDLLNFLEEVANQQKSVVIIAEDVDGEALTSLVVNKLRGVLSCVAVKAPGFGDRRKEMLKDIAILVGADLVSEEKGMKLTDASFDVLGNAERVIVGKDTTTIIGGRGEPDAIKNRCDEIRHQMEETASDYDKEKLQERLARLSGGVAVIRVGAPSETELKSLKEAFDDAISATKAAVEEGIVPGAGLALIKTISAVEKEAAKYDGDVRTGIMTLRRALEAPSRQIAENSGMDPGVVVEKMRAGKGNMGFDGSTNQYVNLFEHGIIDPTKVVRVALENAVSVASVLLLTEATMTDIEEPEAGKSHTSDYGGDFGE
ncbi:chaperonin GroEL [Rhodohalobacter sulfatireducens]|uniref:Chaperonin GroEL n=1 Tax=Rhodohalobacter sulfatireducens TaxID=2911366 RepID=A0ABS9K932_9BACT|nr:chaperonin GroEL [Rhodohalobacter sulfatireducens]MCG2587318.1 chaperonin GroEL [Rhodohalobacter sulfatireducens]